MPPLPLLIEALSMAATASDDQFSWNLLADLQNMFSYHFMQNAFLAVTVVAVVAGLVGYFMVLRSESFAGHTLANVGFAGAGGAVLLNVAPVVGLLAFCLLAALGIGALGERSARQRSRFDIAIGTVLAASLGLGLLFERLASVSATDVYAILFGLVLGVSDDDITVLVLTAVVTLVILALVGRPLLFASVDPEVAAARGVPVRLLSFVFLVLLAFAVAQAVQVVGVLLIFSLLVTPAAAAAHLTARPALGMLLSVLLALLVSWLGLAVAYYTPYPAGFFLTTLAFAAYLLAWLWHVVRNGRTRRGYAGQAPPGVSEAAEGVVAP